MRLPVILAVLVAILALAIAGISIEGQYTGKLVNITSGGGTTKLVLTIVTKHEEGLINLSGSIYYPSIEQEYAIDGTYVEATQDVALNWTEGRSEFTCTGHLTGLLFDLLRLDCRQSLGAKTVAVFKLKAAKIWL